MLITADFPLAYISRMRPASKFILVWASVSFLTITLSGFHIHADAPHHDVQGPHAHVSHYGAPAELDEDHIDISVCEPATGFSKGEIVALVSALPELLRVPRADTPLSADRQEPLPQRDFRWRPELRGPPSSI